MSLFARGVASIHVNYLGYPATCGSSFHDFIIADKFVIPKGAEIDYSEKVAHLPNCFFPAQPAPSNIRELSPPLAHLNIFLKIALFLDALITHTRFIHPYFLYG